MAFPQVVTPWITIVILVAALIGLWMAPLQQLRGRWLGNPVSQRILWTGNYSEAFQRMLDTFSESKIELIDADPNRGILLGSSGPSLLSGGSTINVRLTTSDGIITLDVKVAASACLFDWGGSNRVLQKLLEAWGELELA